MNAQLLRTCKRLNKFTLEELEIITETDKKVLMPVLDEFIFDKKLTFQNGEYSYHIERTEKRPLVSLPLRFQYHSPEVIGIITKSFCLEIPMDKVCKLVNVHRYCVAKFNKFFRKMLYEKQKSELLEHFKKEPQTARSRVFFEKTMYFYYYNNKLYICEKLLKAPDSKNFEKQQIQEFKKVYSFLTRVTSHNTNEANLPHRLAEMIWRRDHSFEELLTNLNFLIGR